MGKMPWFIAGDLIERDRSRGARPLRRSLWALGGIAVGYVLADRIAPGITSTWWLAAGVLAVALAAALRGRATGAGLLLGVLLLSAGWYAARIHERGADRLALLEAADDEALVGVVGMVVDPPRDLGGGRGALGSYARTEEACAFSLRLVGIERADGTLSAVDGRVRVRVGVPARDVPSFVVPGAMIGMTGRLRPVEPARNPGEPDWLKLAAQDRRVGDVLLPDASLIASQEAPTLWLRLESAVRSALGSLQARCVRVLDGGQTGPATPERALLGALLLGQRDAALDDVNAAFTRLGLLHLVAISGFNLAVMAFVVTFLLRLTGDRGWLEPTIVAMLVAGYMLILPAQAPILRAGLIVLVLLVAEALGRRYDRTTLLGWIACVLLLWRPMDLWSLGFQLSFGIVGSLLVFGDVMHRRIWGVPIRGLAPRHERHGRIGRLDWMPKVYQWSVHAFQAQVSASVLAWGVSLPVIAAHTGQISLLAPLTTLIVLPLTVIVLWAGYIVLLLGVLVPGVGLVLGPVLDGLAGMVVHVVMALDRVPGAFVQLPQLSVLWAIACVAAFLVVLTRLTMRDARVWASVALLSGLLAMQLWLLPRAPRDAALRIDTLAVGDGTCHVLRAGSETMLVDCGSLSTGVGERLIPEACRALGVWHVPTVLISHANLDHYSGVLDVLEPLRVRRVILTGQFLQAARPGNAAGALIDGLRARGIEIVQMHAGDTLPLGDILGQVIWPPKDRAFSNLNDSSLGVRFDVATGAGSRRALFLGDAAREALAELSALAEAGTGEVAADVLESPHHGSFNEVSAHLLRVLDPKVVLQSTGQRRAEDDRWEGFKRDRIWHVTDTHGACWVEIRRDGTIATGTFR